MKKILKSLSVILCVTFLAMSVLSGCADGGQEKTTIRVYNWGEYIADGVLEQFEEETGIRVEYDTFNDNESLYAKVKNAGSDSYDIIVPSDYMVKKMIEEDMLAQINYENIPNIVNLDPQYKNLSYDPQSAYSVAYLTDMVGILYNIDETGREITSIEDLFDPAFARKVCMLDSIRDTIGLTLKMLGYSMNDTDPEHIAQARDILLEQKPRVLAYGTDELAPKVMSGAAAMAMVYLGEGITAIEEQPENMRFTIPSEGTNRAVDAFAILKTSKNKEAAEAFINFMLRPDIALKNSVETGYSTPNAKAKELLDDEIKNDKNRYPSKEILDKCEIFETLPADNTSFIDAWNMVKAK